MKKSIVTLICASRFLSIITQKTTGIASFLLNVFSSKKIRTFRSYNTADHTARRKGFLSKGTLKIVIFFSTYQLNLHFILLRDSPFIINQLSFTWAIS